MKTKILAQPYEKEKIKLIRIHPGKARSIFMTWESIAEILEFDYETELKKSGNLVDLAFTKTQEYVKRIPDELEELEEAQILKVENQYLDALKKHWSLPNILLKHLKLKENTEEFNKWAQIGPKIACIFTVSPKQGFAVDYFPNNAGISFTVYESFMIPHTELYYNEYDFLPEWNFEDLMGSDIVETYLMLESYLENDIVIDLNGWNDKF